MSGRWDGLWSGPGEAQGDSPGVRESQVWGHPPSCSKGHEALPGRPGTWKGIPVQWVQIAILTLPRAFRPVCLNSLSSSEEQGWGAAGEGRVGERQPAVSLQGQACIRLFLNLRDLSVLCRGKKGRREGCCSSSLSCEALWSELCMGQEGWFLASPGGCGLRQAPAFLGPLTWSDREL